MEKCQSIDISKGQGNAALQAEMIDQKQRQSWICAVFFNALGAEGN